MRVLVTGGTGYVGCHTVKALLDRGHAVRLLVRSPARIAPAFEPLNVAKLDSVTGDVLDPAAVETAMRGCDALVHAASIYSLDSRQARRVLDANPRGTDLVLGAARRLRLDPIVYVSSFVALLPPDGVLTPDSPVKAPACFYSRSKAEAERVARRYQEAGAPVVITYPGAVWGPHDPHLGDQLFRLRNILKGRLPMLPSGGFPVVDVRDVAEVHARVMEPGQGARRFMATGHYVTMSEAHRGLEKATGRRIPTLFLPAGPLETFGRGVDLLQRVLPVRLPVEREGIYITRWRARCDDSRTRQALGIAWRDLEATIVDSVRWLFERGHISAREAGRCALAA